MYFQFLLRDPYPGTPWELRVDPERGLEWFEVRGWLMMLSDMQLKDEEMYRDHAEDFLADEVGFHREFAAAFVTSQAICLLLEIHGSLLRDCLCLTEEANGAGDVTSQAIN